MAIRILVVDEAAFVRDSLKRALRQFLPNVDIFDAVNGNRALPLLRANKIDLTIADWELPEMSGEELLKWIREQDDYQRMPFIVLSGVVDRTLVMKAAEAGANDCMAKPFSPDDVQKKVVKQLARLGYKPKLKNQSAVSGLAALTGGAAPKAKAQKPREVKSGAEALMQGASGSAGALGARKAPAKKTKSKRGFNGSALLSVGNETCRCAIQDASLTAVNLVCDRPETMLQVFDRGTVEIADDKAEVLAKLNIYIHMTQASEPRPDAAKLCIVARYIDNAPEDMEALSKAIAR